VGLAPPKSGGSRNDAAGSRTEDGDMKRRLFISGLFVALLALALIGVFVRAGE
jgi:hypothetical protein